MQYLATQSQIGFSETLQTRWRASGESTLAERVLRAQLDGIYSHVAKASIISTIFALLLAIYLTPVFGASQVKVWFAAKALISAMRFGLGWAYQSNRFNISPSLANKLIVGSLAIDGAIWGFAGVWGVGQKSEIVCLLVACLSSVAMLATFGLQVRQQATAAYVAPMLLPVIAALAWRGDTLGMFGAAGALLVVVQTWVTGYASEKRLKAEFVARETTADALEERSVALADASSSKAELEKALFLASKTSGELAEALDEVRRQSAVKALFLGTMSHELRTPLHGILGMTELVQQRVTDPTDRHRLELVRSSGNHLLELISALLDVSRIDSGKLELNDTAFNLSDEVRNMFDLYNVRCQSKAVGFQGMKTIGRGCWVNGDAARIRQVLHNLLGNAVKFTERGLVRFKVSNTGDLFSFDIADTGTGISAEALPHIFDAFRQVDGAEELPSAGAGLGLTIARELARAMGGDIEVTSVKGVGSRFIFTARLSFVVEDAIPQKAPSVDHGITYFREDLRVLLVEDNEVNAMIATAHLTQLGLEPIRAHDGREAVKAAFAEPRPDMILMDCRMPVMDGPTATREIRSIERRQGLQPIPIIALTAMPSEEDRKECLDSGMNGFLTKPFASDDLVKALNDVVVSEASANMKSHPMFEFARSLEDMEPDLSVFGSLVH